MAAALTLLPSLDRIAALAAECHLTVLGGFHPGPGEPGVPSGGTVLLLGPREPGFWEQVKRQPEMTDGATDPLDRWSRRVLDALAHRLEATALYPFDGPPYLPFVSWAARTGRAWSSPVKLLVHCDAGLMVSIRGAMAFDEPIDLPPAQAAPCADCASRPCETACPVAALTPSGYDTGACHDYLDNAAGTDCAKRGCAVRRACPVSHAYPRAPEQSAFHMRAFHGNR